MKDLTHGLFKLPSKEERIAARAGASLNPLKLGACCRRAPASRPY